MLIVELFKWCVPSLAEVNPLQTTYVSMLVKQYNIRLFKRFAHVNLESSKWQYVYMNLKTILNKNFLKKTVQKLLLYL